MEGADGGRVLIDRTYKSLAVITQISHIDYFIHKTSLSAISRTGFVMILFDHIVHFFDHRSQRLTGILFLDQTAGIGGCGCGFAMHDIDFSSGCSQGKDIVVVGIRPAHDIMSSSGAFS